MRITNSEKGQRNSQKNKTRQIKRPKYYKSHYIDVAAIKMEREHQVSWLEWLLLSFCNEMVGLSRHSTDYEVYAGISKWNSCNEMLVWCTGKLHFIELIWLVNMICVLNQLQYITGKCWLLRLIIKNFLLVLLFFRKYSK